LCDTTHLRITKASKSTGIFDGTFYAAEKVPSLEDALALTDTLIKNLKPTDKPTGTKHPDGGGMYLLVKQSGKYWRLDYRYLSKRKTLALGVYPTVSLAKARKRREEARVLLSEGIDPSQAKRDDRQARQDLAANTFELIARDWLLKTKATRVESTQGKLTTWLEKDIFPTIGNKPVSTIKPRDVLQAVQKMEARGAIETAHRIKQICGQIFRYAVATGGAERDVTADLKGAIAPVPKTHYAAITEPKLAGELLRAIHGFLDMPTPRQH